MINKQKINLKNLILAAAFFLCIFTIGKILYFSGNIISIATMHNSYNEVRDYASFRLTHLLLEGKNPYAPELLSEINVPFLDLYTIAVPALTAAVCKLTNLQIIEGYHLVNLLLFAITVVNLWLIIRDFAPNNKILIFFCIVINSATFFAMFGVPLFNFRPDTATFFLSTLIFIILYKNKKRTFFLAALTVLLLFTRQFMIITSIPIFLYYLLSGEKKLAFRYFCQCIITGAAAIIFIQFLFPLYWTETIFVQFLTSKTYGEFTSAIQNIWQFYYRYFMNLVLILIGFLRIYQIKRKSERKQSLSLLIHEFAAENNFAFYLILNLFIFTIFLLYLAKCGGDGYKYCQDLLAPSLFLLTAWIWLKIFPQSMQSDTKETGISLLILCFCLAAVINYSHFETATYTKNDVENFIALDTDISKYGSEKMYLSINSAQYLINNDIWEPDSIDFNDGKIEYFNIQYPDNPLYDIIFHPAEIQTAANNYAKRVNDNVSSRQYSLITTCIDNIIDMDLLGQNYHQYKTYPVKTEANGKRYEVTLWLPNE